MATVIGNLRADIELIRPGRHGNYYMLFDPSSEHYFKIGESAVQILSRLDQPYELEAFMTRLQRTGVQTTRDEVVSLINFLVQNSLMEPGYGQIEMQKKKVEEIKRQTRFLRWASAYMFIKLPPLRPARMLEALKPYTDFLVSRWMITLFLIPALLGYLFVLRDFSAVRATFMDSLSWAGLAKYFVAIVLLKIVHEMAHSLAANHFGCKVRAVGMSFIVFYPRLFTDTTDSWRLPRKQRLLIDAGGVISELLVGGIAALLWCYMPPGAGKSTMFYIFAVSTLSTILANGNPLIRYDGYYILCDLLNMENLMGRSIEYLRSVFRWAVFGVGERPEEKRWVLLLTFGIAAFIYKIFLYTAIILIIYAQFIKAVAVVLLLAEVYVLLIFPLWRELKTIRALSKKAAKKADRLRIAVLLAGIGVVLFFPLSWDVSLPAEIQPVRRELVVTQEAGILVSEWPRTARQVRKGETLYLLSSPHLEFGVERFHWMAQADELLFSMQQLDRESYGDSLLTREKLKSDWIGIREMKRRSKMLRGIAAEDGLFIPVRDDISKGSWFPAGLCIGELVSPQLAVTAYADDREVRKLKEGTSVTIYLPDTLKTFRGTVSRLERIPAKLQHSPLLQVFGGPIPVYPDEKQVGGFISVNALYRVEISFDDPEIRQLQGRTAMARVHHRERLAGKIFAFAVSILRREF
ncbi:MAG: hypothetical protein J6S73_00885 [Lentisphaeria bacterium]|nr:hypothetical protein [Lentisphaeria bacterium]